MCHSTVTTVLRKFARALVVGDPSLRAYVLRPWLCCAHWHRSDTIRFKAPPSPGKQVFAARLSLYHCPCPCQRMQAPPQELQTPQE